MELHICGRNDGAVVLLLGGAGIDADALLSRMPKLEKTYYLLVPVFSADESEDARLDALEQMLTEQFSGRIWGGYGLAEGAGLLLRLVLRGSIRLRACVLEGAFAAGEGIGGGPTETKLIHWAGAKDKAAKKTREALLEAVPSLNRLTIKKLPKGECFAAARPDLAEARLIRDLGQCVTVTRTAVLDGSVEDIWERMRLYPTGDAALVGRIDRLRFDREKRTHLLKGSSKKLRLWSHQVRLESLGEDGTIRTDQVELDAAKLNAVYRPLAGLLLKKEQRALARALKRGRHAL